MVMRERKDGYSLSDVLMKSKNDAHLLTFARRARRLGYVRPLAPISFSAYRTLKKRDDFPGAWTSSEKHRLDLLLNRCGHFVHYWKLCLSPSRFGRGALWPKVLWPNCRATCSWQRRSSVVLQWPNLRLVCASKKRVLVLPQRHQIMTGIQLLWRSSPKLKQRGKRDVRT